MLIAFENTDDLERIIDYKEDLEAAGAKITRQLISEDKVQFECSIPNPEEFEMKFIQTPSALFAEDL